MSTVVSNHYSGVTRFLPVVGVLLLGLVAALFGYIWAWPLAFGSAVALVVWVLGKENPAAPARKFFGGLALTFLASAVALGAFGAIAVAVGLV